MNILYIAYSCSPNYGSEDKIGWSVPLESARKNNVHVLTKVEHKKGIEEYWTRHGSSKVQFHYVDIPDVYKRLFKGVFYSGRLGIWNKRALNVAAEICKKYDIELIHQITPVEFRSIGEYWKIPNIKFVCGPISGGQSVPKGLRSYLKTKDLMVELLCTCINEYYRRFVVSRRIKQTDYMLYANHETKEFVEALSSKPRNCTIVSDVSIDAEDLILAQAERGNEKRRCRFLIVGRLAYRKGHKFAFEALRRLPEALDYECRIVGNGPQREELKAMCEAEPLAQHVSLVGAVPFVEIKNEYDSADVLIMPSFREATGSVLLEAMARGVPVITINKFGGATILDNDSGWLYDGCSKEDYVENLKNALISCISDQEEVARKGNNARRRAEAYTWQARMRVYQQIYDKVMSCE